MCNVFCNTNSIMKILIFDTETGGLNPYRNDILQLSFQVIDGDTFNTLLVSNYYFPCPDDENRVEWDEARDGASNGSSHPPHSCRHRSRHLTKNQQSRALIAVWRTPQTRHFVDYRTHKTGKLFHHVKYSPERSDFLRFYAYLCHVIDDFCLSWFAALR